MRLAVPTGAELVAIWQHVAAGTLGKACFSARRCQVARAIGAPCKAHLVFQNRRPNSMVHDWVTGVVLGARSYAVDNAHLSAAGTAHLFDVL